jgi:VanZ family protein
MVTYLSAWLRIGTLEERTHLFEYGLVAALVHEALVERQENGRWVPRTAVLALVISVLLGWLDEGIQSILPNRVYDIRDVLFNTVAAVMVIGARWALARVRRWAHARRPDG